MQYIEKTLFEPKHWDEWFTTEARVIRYDNIGDGGRNSVKEFLLQEQSGLCAYCQRERQMSDSSIEHVTPNNSNPNLSTHYHNLVAACKDSTKDIGGRKHCDKERGNTLLAPLIFYKQAQVTVDSTHGFLDAKWDGTISPLITSPNSPVHKQVAAFIEILNLNHADLVERRKEAWKRVVDEAIDKDDSYWSTEFMRLLEDKAQPFRQFLLILIRKKLQQKGRLRHHTGL